MICKNIIEMKNTAMKISLAKIEAQLQSLVEGSMERLFLHPTAGQPTWLSGSVVEPAT